jgi:LPXTG-motif cell wall-anchored protein
MDQCITRTVTVTVTPVGTDDTATTTSNTPVSIDVLANDPAGSSLDVIAVSDAPNGTVTINPDGTVRYVPDVGFSGIDTFTYTACVVPAASPTGVRTALTQAVGDELCITRTVTVTVRPAGADDTATTPAGTPVQISVLGNDPAAPSLTVGAVTDPPNGSALIGPSGTVTYTPDPGFAGVDTFTYTACDAAGQCVTQTVTVTVEPTATDDVTTTTPGVPVVIRVLGNDPSQASLVVRSVTDPAHGTATVNPDGTITYTPDPGFAGVDTFTYTACDAANQCVTRTVTVTIQTLPRTGGSITASAQAAALMFGVGLALWLTARRRRRTQLA